MKNVTVIGAGIVGICSALSLAQAGARVRLIDRDLPGQGASAGNAGVISPWSIIPQSMPGVWKNIPRWLLDPNGPVSIKLSHLPHLLPWTMKFLSNAKMDRVHASVAAMHTLNHLNVELYRAHLAGTGHENLIRDSFYVHAFRNADSARLNTLEYRLRQEKGAQLERIGQGDLQDLEPALSKDFKAAILIKGQASATSPGKIGEVLAEKFCSLGGMIEQAEVRGLRPGKEAWEIITSAGTQTAENLLLSAGAWSADLLRPLGINIPMQAERGYHAMFENPGLTLKHSVMDVDHKCVASSMEGGLRVAGQAEFANINAPQSPARAQRMGLLARKMMPDLPDTQPTTWMGVRPSLPDSLPCIGAIPGRKNLYAAFGHSHYGLMMAPKTGQLISDIIMNKPINEDISPFRVYRF
ncbi:NAD(P)/FAD-dependent oxidoreductase [Kiloniella sp.]|uniref:NAD(P)/FAD-dependent oxidoreductase n=1 Tax=Kiloniella sp. TaxID=1938587 RepID=UPI003B026EC0